MGGGTWSTNSYDAKESWKARSGTPSFAYTHRMASTPFADRKAHEMLTPTYVNKKGEHEGLKTREAFDSDEHPNSTPIAVLFDVTGSMGQAPYTLQEKLKGLHGLLQRKGYVEDPQIMFGGIGDAHCDRVPLQVSQFESDNRMDEHLENIYVESGGGGGNHESYELAMYFMSRHTELDSLRKRGKKGYLFIVGDERIYRKVNRDQVKAFIDDDNLQEDIDTLDIVRELQEKYEVFFLFANNVSYKPENTVDEDAGNDTAYGWRTVLGERALVLDDINAVAETIGMLLGMSEGTVTYDEGLEDLADVGFDKGAIEATSKALATVGASGTSVATTEGGDLPEVSGDSGGTERL